MGDRGAAPLAASWSHDHEPASTSRVHPPTRLPCVRIGVLCAALACGRNVGSSGAPASRRPGAVPPLSAALPCPLMCRSMSDTAGQLSSSSAPRAPWAEDLRFAAYLRAVADALAAPNTTADSVLAAAGAITTERIGDFTWFRLPDRRLAGNMGLRPSIGGRSEPESVTFECGPGHGCPTLADVVSAFGPWAPGHQATSLAPIWRIVFTSEYRHPGPARPGAGVIRVAADLAAADLLSSDVVRHPPPHTARVVRILLRRDIDDAR